MSVTPGTAEKSGVDETASPHIVAGSAHVQFASRELEGLGVSGPLRAPGVVAWPVTEDTDNSQGCGATPGSVSSLGEAWWTAGWGLTTRQGLFVLGTSYDTLKCVRVYVCVCARAGVCGCVCVCA